MAVTRGAASNGAAYSKEHLHARAPFGAEKPTPRHDAAVPKDGEDPFGCIALCIIPRSQLGTFGPNQLQIFHSGVTCVGPLRCGDTHDLTFQDLDRTIEGLLRERDLRVVVGKPACASFATQGSPPLRYWVGRNSAFRGHNHALISRIITNWERDMRRSLLAVLGFALPLSLGMADAAVAHASDDPRPGTYAATKATVESVARSAGAPSRCVAVERTRASAKWVVWSPSDYALTDPAGIEKCGFSESAVVFAKKQGRNWLTVYVNSQPQCSGLRGDLTKARAPKAVVQDFLSGGLCSDY